MTRLALFVALAVVPACETQSDTVPKGIPASTVGGLNARADEGLSGGSGEQSSGFPSMPPATQITTPENPSQREDEVNARPFAQGAVPEMGALAETDLGDASTGGQQAQNPLAGLDGHIGGPLSAGVDDDSEDEAVSPWSGGGMRALDAGAGGLGLSGAQDLSEPQLANSGGSMDESPPSNFQGGTGVAGHLVNDPPFDNPSDAQDTQAGFEMGQEGESGPLSLVAAVPGFWNQAGHDNGHAGEPDSGHPSDAPGGGSASPADGISDQGETAFLAAGRTVFCGALEEDCGDVSAQQVNQICLDTRCAPVCARGYRRSEVDSSFQCVPELTCGHQAILEIDTQRVADDLEMLTAGLETVPAPIVLPTSSNGTVRLGLRSESFPVITGNEGTFIAASHFGLGRVVAFSGQDFIGSSERSSLLGIDSVDRLIANAVNWVAPRGLNRPLKIRVDNQRLADTLNQFGHSGVAVAPTNFTQGLWQTRDWSWQALSNVDVAIVQINEWGTLRVHPGHIDALRLFLAEGGGLLIAGSALHWSWWLHESASRFIGDLILDGAGITWNVDEVKDLSTGRLAQGDRVINTQLWCDYLAGETLDALEFNRLEGLFESAKTQGRDVELDRALNRLLEEAPPLPVSPESPFARLAANVAATLPPHPWPRIHPWASTFPGLPQGPPINDGQATLNTGWSGAQPLGFYAPPGQPVRVTVPAHMVDDGFRIRVGDLYDDLRVAPRVRVWSRAPLLWREFPLDERQIDVVNAFGGPLYLLSASHRDTQLQLGVDGGIPMIVYSQGQSIPPAWTRAHWRPAAPQSILQSQGRVRMVVDSHALAAVQNPDAVLEFWSGFHQMHAQLAQEPTPRAYESHWLFDVQVGWGYANATQDRIAYPKLAEGWGLRTRQGDEDWWLFGHELGHQFQSDDWRGNGVTEVCVNLFTMYTLNYYIHGGGNFDTLGRFEPDAVDHASLLGVVWAEAGVFGKLELYRQLIHTFGWSAFKDTFASYYDLAYPRHQFGGELDGFAIRFSAVVERDLSAFLLRWQYPVSESALAIIASFGFETWLPPGW